MWVIWIEGRAEHVLWSSLTHLGKRKNEKIGFITFFDILGIILQTCLNYFRLHNLLICPCPPTCPVETCPTFTCPNLTCPVSNCPALSYDIDTSTFSETKLLNVGDTSTFSQTTTRIETTFSSKDPHFGMTTETLLIKNENVHPLPQWVVIAVPILSVFVVGLLVSIVLILIFLVDFNGNKPCKSCKKMKSRFHSSPLPSRSHQSQNHLTSSTRVSDQSFSFVNHTNSENVEQILLCPYPSVSEQEKTKDFHSVIEF